MPIHRTLAISCVAAAMSLACHSASAQVASSLTWHEAQGESFPGKAEILLTADPAVHHSCRVRSVENDRILCSRHLRKPVVYRRDDIQEIIARKYDTSPWPAILIGGVGVGGGIITGAVFLAMTGPIGIVGAVPVAFCGFMFGGFCAVFDDGAQHDTRHIAYLRPGLAPSEAAR